MRTLLLVSLSALGLLGAQQSAEASTITFAGAPAGLTFSIESVNPTTDLFAESPTQLNDTYLVTLQLITTTAYNDATRYLQSVALDVGGSVDAATLVSPNVGWGADVNKGIHSPNGKCVDDQPGGICVEADPAMPNPSLKADRTYSWVFKIDLNDTTGINAIPTLVFATATLKPNGAAQWEDTIVSEALTGSEAVDLLALGPPAAVPEPTSMLLLGSGLAGLVAYRWRLRRR